MTGEAVAIDALLRGQSVALIVPTFALGRPILDRVTEQALRTFGVPATYHEGRSVLTVGARGQLRVLAESSWEPQLWRGLHFDVVWAPYVVSPPFDVEVLQWVDDTSRIVEGP